MSCMYAYTLSLLIRYDLDRSFSLLVLRRFTSIGFPSQGSSVLLLVRWQR